jgi:hypothetical protein
VGEKALKEGMVELKPRREKENRLVRLSRLSSLAGPAEFRDLIDER